MNTIYHLVKLCEPETDPNKTIIAAITIVILAPLSWVRAVEKFQTGYIFSVLVLLGLVIIVSTFIFLDLSDHEWQAGPDWTPFNESGYITMWGISFYTMRVNSILPVMDASSYKDKFHYLLIGALTLLLCVHLYFSSLCYYNYGSNLNEPLVIEKMPQDNPWIVIGRLLYLVVIIFSFPLMIYIVNPVIEGYVFGKMRYSFLRTWLKNLSRTVVVAVSVLTSYLFYYQLYKILAFSGVILGNFIVLITPTLIHYKVVAETKYSKTMNIGIVIYSSVLAVVLSSLIVAIWGKT